MGWLRRALHGLTGGTVVEPYVAYGFPNQKSVRELIYSERATVDGAALIAAERGYGKINKQRIPLTDNHIVEEHLGKYG